MSDDDLIETEERSAAELEAEEIVPIVKGRGRTAHRAQAPRGGLEFWIARGYRVDKTRR